jgi:hypothetical protein
MSSNSGELDSSISLSNSLALSHLQLKRTYCFALVNAKAKTITFYCFTTEHCNYDSIKSLLDQAAEIMNQRYHLLNNTVLYKFGGLIGENLLYDLKKVKSVCISACFNQSGNSSHYNKLHTASTEDSAINREEEAAAKVTKLLITGTTNSIHQKMSKSPVIQRQLSYKSVVAPINPTLINNLQFLDSKGSSSRMSTNKDPQLSSSNVNSSSSAQYLSSSSNQYISNLNTNIVQVKQLTIGSFNQKSYDSISKIINKQLEFCALFLINNSNGATGGIGVASSSSGFSMVDSPNSAFTSTLASKPNQLGNFSNSNRSIYSSLNQQFSNASSSSGFSSLYGVGLCYQLYEMQQIYRHPRKIYELALSLSNIQSPTNASGSNMIKGTSVVSMSSKDNNRNKHSTTSTTSNTIPLSSNLSQAQFKNQLSINEFYKNNILPVLIPLHYCCTPILFYSDWTDVIVTESSLKNSNPNRFLQNRMNEGHFSLTNKMFGVKVNTVKTTGIISHDTWYFKMRQSILLEYSKYLESRGFIRLKDEKSNFTNDPNLKQNQHTNYLLETQTYHFIKWIQQDGFLYITFNIEEIYLHVKIGYCARYRSTSRTFVNEIIKIFTQEFHVHSFVHDFHLLALNQNFSSSGVAGSQISQTSQTIAKFLDEFVDFFMRLPILSINKVFKRVYEKSDHSLIPHQFRLIFDFVIDSITKINSESEEIQLLFKTLYVFDNNIAIYSLTDNVKSNNNNANNNNNNSNNLSSDYLKYLVIKIETQTQLTAATNWSSSSSSQSCFQSFNSLASKKVKDSLPSNIKASTKASNSASSSSLLGFGLGSNLARQESENSTSNTKQQPLIRIVSYYLCINKNQSPQESSSVSQKHQEDSATGSLASISLLNKFNEDLHCIDRVIENSISLYKQEIFWDNLSSSMSPLTDILNENLSNMMSSASISFSVNSQELEQILAISEKVNILDLDANLADFLNECYTIKDKIRDYIRFSFGRHFIFTSCENVEYCILLINDELIRKFRQTFSTSSSTPTNTMSQSSSFTLNEGQPGSLQSHGVSSQKKSSNSISESGELKSFVLLKFDKVAKKACLIQVNRVKVLQKKDTSSKRQNQVAPKNLVTKRSSTTDTISIIQQSSNPSNVASEHHSATTVPILSSSLKDPISSMMQSSISGSLNTGSVKTHKYLSFTVNTLMYVLWESIFSS